MDLESAESFFCAPQTDSASIRQPTSQHSMISGVLVNTPMDGTDAPSPKDVVDPAYNSVNKSNGPMRLVVPSSPLHGAESSQLDRDLEDDGAGHLRRNSSSVDVAESVLLNNATADQFANRRFDLASASASESQRWEEVEEGAEPTDRARAFLNNASSPKSSNIDKQTVQLLNDSSNSPAIIAHSQSHDGILSSSPKDASAQLHPHYLQQSHFRPNHSRNGSAGGESLCGSKLPHKNLLTYTMEDQAMLMKTRMRSLSLPYALKVKSPETIAKESGNPIALDTIIAVPRLRNVSQSVARMSVLEYLECLERKGWTPLYSVYLVQFLL